MINLPPRYSQVVKPLSGGGMSDTLLCKDQNLNRHVVVKSLKAGIEKHRLMDELSALSNIRSKYVVQVFDIIRDGTEIIGFVEEYIDGSDLTPLSSTASENELLSILFSIISGICDIHAHGRVHRDIKPDNMKLDASGVLKIFDFGLAKGSADAKTKQLFYTQYYTPPEVFTPNKDGHHEFTNSVDVFAFGATALWLANGGALPAYLGHLPPSVPQKPAVFGSLPIKLSSDIVMALDACLSSDANFRPTGTMIKAIIGKRLLFDKHKMLITFSGSTHFVDASKRQVSLNAGSDSVTIGYNGLDFVVTHVSGHVRHNNVQVTPGYVLSGSSVIVLGNPAHRGRTSITADVSHPEVMH